MPEIITRREAISLQRRKFYTGKPCKYGHDCERYVLNGGCILCINPKLTSADLPPPLEDFKFPDGRIVKRITQEEAYRRGWTVFFTGQPCSKGHMAERNIKNGQCLECLHPPKYGPDAYTGWFPFQPKPPLRLPKETSLTLWYDIARKLQEKIPGILEELSAPVVSTEPETCRIHLVFHRHFGHRWNGLKMWYPYPPGAREIFTQCDRRAVPSDVPWVERGGEWLAVLPGGSVIPVVKPYDPTEGRRKSNAEARAVTKDEK